MRQATPRQSLRIKNFRGVLQKATTDQLPENVLADALNYTITDNGELAPRTGFELFADDKTPDGLPILSICAADMDGEILILVATANNIFSYDPDTDVWATVYAIAEADRNPGHRPTFAPMNQNAAPFVVVGNGKMHPQILEYSAGWTASACGADTPHGRPVSYRNYLVFFDIASAPGKVAFGWYPGDPDTFKVDGIEKYLEMRGTVTAVWAFPTGLLVFSGTRTEVFIGDPDQPTGMQVLSETVGCVSFESIADCNGIVFWVAQGGVMVWNGGGNFPSACISKPDDGNASNIARDFDLIAWDELDKITGAYNPLERQYMISAKIDTTGSDTVWRTWVYDLADAAWYPWDLEATAMTGVIDPATSRNYVLNGTSGGLLRIQSDDTMVDATDDAAAGTTFEYDYWFKLPDMDFGLPEQSKLCRAVGITSPGALKKLPVGVRTVEMWLRGEYEDFQTDEISMAANSGGFILGINLVGDELSTASRMKRAIATCNILAKYINIYSSGKGVANAVPISEILVEWRPFSNRQDLISHRST